jgi:multicomponent Na+:H+ antiporter subunit A
MDNGIGLVAALLIPFFASALSPLAQRWRPRAGALLGAVAGTASLTLLVAAWLTGSARFEVSWIPVAGASLVLRLDALGALFAFLVTGIGAAIFLYAYTYMADAEGLGRFYAYLALFMGAMLGIALAGDLLALFVFWEITTLCSFLLIGFYDRDPAAVRSAFKALLLTGAGGIALLVAFLGMASVAGSFGLEAVLAAGDALRSDALYVPILLLFAIGVAAKSAQFPLHIWLPDAMVAPTPVSAYLHSAAMVKAGIYLLARFLPGLVSSAWETVLVPLGFATILVGGVLAIHAVDLKRILAYGTISQLGLLASAFGFAGGLGQEAGIFHLLNHALFKASLFLVAGAVTSATGLADIRELGGLRRRAPVTAVACALAVLSMAGIPPLGGFLSKELYLEAALHAGLGWAVLATAAGGLTVAYSVSFFVRIFLGPPRGDSTDRESLGLALPALVLAAGSLLLGLGPELARPLVEGAIVVPAGVAFGPSLLRPHLEPLAMSAASIGLGALIVWRYGEAASAIGSLLRRVRWITVDAAYDRAVEGMRTGARRVALFLQNGALRRYTGLLIAFALIVLLAPAPIPEIEVPPLEDLGAVVFTILLLLMVVFAILATFVPDTLHAILSLSGMGFLLAISFMLLHAPDLAMTQILVEMVFLVMFLVVLYRIPKHAVQAPRARRNVDIAIAVGLAIGVTYVVSLSVSAFYYPSIAEFFLDPTLVDRTGGRNVVNVIITDFRAFDTLAETAVVALSALGVYTLLRRWKGE